MPVNEFFRGVPVTIPPGINLDCRRWLAFSPRHKKKKPRHKGIEASWGIISSDLEQSTINSGTEATRPISYQLSRERDLSGESMTVGEFGRGDSSVNKEKRLDERGGEGVFWESLKIVYRSPGTLAGFFMPAASRWEPPGSGWRKPLGDQFTIARARSGFLLGVAHISNLKSVNKMKTKGTPPGGQVSGCISVDAPVDYVDKSVLFRLNRWDDLPRIGKVLGYRIELLHHDSKLQTETRLLIQRERSGNVPEIKPENVRILKPSRVKAFREILQFIEEVGK